MQDIRDAILSGDRSEQTYASLTLPETYRGVTVHKDEVDLFEGVESRDKARSGKAAELATRPCHCRLLSLA